MATCALLPEPRRSVSPKILSQRPSLMLGAPAVTSRDGSRHDVDSFKPEGEIFGGGCSWRETCEDCPLVSVPSRFRTRSQPNHHHTRKQGSMAPERPLKPENLLKIPAIRGTHADKPSWACPRQTSVLSKLASPGKGRKVKSIDIPRPLSV